MQGAEKMALDVSRRLCEPSPCARSASQARCGFLATALVPCAECAGAAPGRAAGHRHVPSPRSSPFSCGADAGLINSAISPRGLRRSLPSHSHWKQESPSPSGQRGKRKSSLRLQRSLGAALHRVCSVVSSSLHGGFPASRHPRVTVSQYLAPPPPYTAQLISGWKKRDNFDIFLGLGIPEHWSQKEPCRASKPVSPGASQRVIWDSCEKTDP